MEEYSENEIHNQFDKEDLTMVWYEDNSFSYESDLEDSTVDDDSDLDSSLDSHSEDDLEQTAHKTASPIPYMLFVYQKEMRRLKNNKMEYSKWKLHLTKEMLAYSVDRIAEYDKDELINIQRQIYFTHELQSDMDSMEEMKKGRESTLF